MSIANRIEQIENHLKDDYQSIANLGADLTNVDKNIENISELLDGVYDVLPKTSFQEGTEVTIENGLKGKLDYENNIVGYGDTSQKSYEGYNLLDVANASTTLEKATFTKLQTGYTVVTTNEVDSSHYGRLMIETSFIDSSKTYSFTCDLTCSDSYNSGELMLGWVGASKFSRPTPTANTKTHVFGTFSGITTTMFSIASYKANATIKVENFQIYEGSTDKTYEPYTNGASPNPSYPQEIEVVRGKNRLDDSNLILFNSNKYISTSNFSTEGKIEIKPSSTYSLVYKKSTINDFNMWEFDSSNNKTAISSTGSDNGNYRVRLFTTLSTTKTMSFYAGSNDTYTSTEEFLQAKELMLLEGDYSSQEIPSYLPYNTIEVKARGLNSFDYSVIDNNHISMSNPNNATISFNDNGFTITPITQGDNYTISGMDITNTTIRSDLRKYLIEVKPNTAYTFIMGLNYSALGGLSAYYSLIDSNYKVTAFAATTSNYKVIDSTNRRYFVNITTSADTKYIGFRYGNQGPQPVTYTNIMLVEGTYNADTLPTYESYYTPQIKQLSLGNFKPSKIGNYKDYFYRTSGKNKFDNSVERKNAYIGASGSDIGTAITYYNSSATYTYVNCAYVESGKTYTLSWKQSTTPASTNLRVGAIVDNNNIILNTQNTWTSSRTSITFTPSVSGYLVLCTDINATNIQLELGNTATEYNPYGSGEWYFKGKIVEVILNSSYRASGGTTGTNAYYIATKLTDGLNDNTIALAYSNMFSPCAFNDRNGAPDSVMLQSGSVTLRTRNNTDIDWSDNTKRDAWLNANTPLVYYVLAMPTDTKITDTTMITQLEEIYNLMSYTGTTIITSNGDLPMIIKVRALKGA